MKIKNNLVLFWDGPFSNFDDVEGGIAWKGWHHQTSEHIFMFEKAMFFGDSETAYKILLAETPMEAKLLGRKVKGFNSDAWTAVSYGIMLEACRAKFTQSEYHRTRLFYYGVNHRFVEASPYDCIWGIGWHENDPEAADPSKWQGQNLLGKLLDQIFEEEYTDHPGVFEV